MSVKQMAKMIGRKGRISAGQVMVIDVEVIDVKNAYGTLRYKVKPVAGIGSEWINADRFVEATS